MAKEGIVSGKPEVPPVPIHLVALTDQSTLQLPVSSSFLLHLHRLSVLGSASPKVLFGLICLSSMYHYCGYIYAIIKMVDDPLGRMEHKG